MLLQEFGRDDFAEFAVIGREDDSRGLLQESGERLFGRVGRDMRIVGDDSRFVVLERLDDFQGRGFAEIVDVCLVGHSQHADSRAVQGHFLVVQEVLQELDGIGWHAVVDLAGDLEEAVVEAGLFGSLDEVVGVNRDAVAADAAGGIVSHESKWLGRGAVDDVLGIDAEDIEGFRELVHEGDIDVAERILDDLDCFGFADGFHRSDLGVDDGLVEIECLGEASGIEGADDTRDIRHIPFGIAGIDALRAVGDVDIATYFPAAFFEDRSDDFLGDAGIDGRFEDDERAFLGISRDELGCAHDRDEIGIERLVDRGRYADEENVSLPKLFLIGRRADLESADVFLQEGILDRGDVFFEEGDLFLVCVESDHIIPALTCSEGEGESDIAETDDCDD